MLRFESYDSILQKSAEGVLQRTRTVRSVPLRYGKVTGTALCSVAVAVSIHTAFSLQGTPSPITLTFQAVLHFATLYLTLPYLIRFNIL